MQTKLKQYGVNFTMVKVQKAERWLSQADFSINNPAKFKIKAVIVDAKEGDRYDYTLNLENTLEQRRNLSIWGDNLNKMIDRFGDDTDNWINKEISIQLVEDVATGKNHRVIE